MGKRVRVGSETGERAACARLADSVARVVGGVEIVRHWSAHDYETPDGLPFIGEAPFGRSGPLAEIVSPTRAPGLTSVLPLAAENTAVAREFMEGHLTSRRAKAHEDSVAGRSCMHLGCETKWNTAEGTVDCPCHGSRYRRHGEAIY